MLIKLVLIVLLAVVVQYVFRMYIWLHFTKHVFNHGPGPCRHVEGIEYGSEDLHVLHNGTTFISSGFFMKNAAPEFEEFYFKHVKNGRIFVFDLNSPTKDAKELSLTSTEDFDRDQFHPHGISVWEDAKSGQVFLFVVNHQTDGSEKIEKFRVSLGQMSLHHVKSYTGDPAIRTMNDVAATGENSFYFTNFMYSESVISRLVEGFGFFPWTDVVYFDGNEYKVVADTLLSANGIDLSHDGRYVYVATSNGREFRIYERQTDNSLLLKEVFPLHVSPDNIVVDPVTGDAYVGIHPVGYLALTHLVNPENRAPSQVIQIKMKGGRVSSVTDLFMDDGSFITGSSVGAVYNRRMLIGSVLDKLVYCDVHVPL